MTEPPPDIDLGAPGFADLYDELPLWSAPFGMMLLDRVPMRDGLAILDVGAATGWLAIELAERCGPESRVVAVDPWREALDRLGRKAAQRGLANVTTVAGDAAAIDLPDGSIDVVVSNLGIHNFDDPARVLAACFRVMKPGARLLLTTNLAGHMAELYEAYREALLALGRADRLPVLADHVAHRGTTDSVAARLRAAGLAIAEIATGSFRMRFANGRTLMRHHFVRLGFLPGWRAIAGEDHAEPVLAALERRLDAIAAEHGELALTVPAACFVARKD